VDAIDLFPDAEITDSGPVSQAFRARGLRTFIAACRYVHQMPYGYNTTREDPLILFRENRGSCTAKHMAVGLLAAELDLSIDKHIGIYAMHEALVTGAGRIAAEHGLPYIPVVHCYLSDETVRVDLTEGNRNGKNSPIDTFLFTAKVRADISDKEEYHLYRQALQRHILTREEMAGIDLKTILRAREAALVLLKTNMAREQKEAS